MHHLRIRTEAKHLSLMRERVARFNRERTHVANETKQSAACLSQVAARDPSKTSRRVNEISDNELMLLFSSTDISFATSILSF